MLSKIPRGRFVEVDEIAALVAWLRLGRVLVHHRRGVRHLRRPGDVLTDTAHEQRRQRLIGIGLMCGAVAAFACLDAMAKYLGTHMPTSAGGRRALRQRRSWSRCCSPTRSPAGHAADRAAGAADSAARFCCSGRPSSTSWRFAISSSTRRWRSCSRRRSWSRSWPAPCSANGSAGGAGPRSGGLRWRAGGGAARPGGHAVGGAALVRQRHLLRRLQHHHADAVATDSSETTLLYGNLFGCLVMAPVLPFVWATPPTWLDVVLMVAMGVLRRRRPFPADPGPPAGAGLGAVAVHLHPDRLGDDAWATWCSPTCPAAGPSPGPYCRRFRPLFAQSRAQGDRQSCTGRARLTK